MKIIIMGGSPFLGRRLARELLRRGKVNDADGRAQPINELVLLDIALPLKGLVSFASGILREPLNGVDAICPVEPEAKL
jgi:nucleoside-diphosphate-sugar epimerase